jgi:hypothetical protein
MVLNLARFKICQTLNENNKNKMYDLKYYS